MKQRILSGIKPTGDIHLGSYLGAMKHWSAYQSPETEVFYFIADLHALNTRSIPAHLRSRSLDLVAWLLALGIDPEENAIFVQSQLPAHAELAWILNNYVTMGELSRMTQYKDKAAKTDATGQLVALFDYPVLMAADILLYDVDTVPVGDDQTQHVELTRDIAKRCNNLYGEMFKIPAFSKPIAGARVMMLDEPTRKMSKSEGGDGCVYLLDDETTIRRKLSRAVTDSDGEIRYDSATKPGVSNLLEIMSAIKGIKPEAAARSLSEGGYGELKTAVADAVVAELKPLQAKYAEIRSDEAQLRQVLEQGRVRAARLAEAKLMAIKHTLGML